MRDLGLSDDRFDDDQLPQLSPHDRCPLHAHHRGFSRLSFRFRSLKSSTVVPVHKNYCVMKPQRNLCVDHKSQASPALVVHAPFQGRSQSFSHAAMHGAITAAKRAVNGSNVAVDASVQVPGRRCNSFNLQSAHHAVIDHDNKVNDHDDVDDDPSSMAAAAVWAGACILAAAAVHDVVSSDHHHDPCRVAMKLRDLMQQSANFSELGLPTMMKLKKAGGGSAINENLAQLVLCHETAAPVALKRKTESVEEEEVMEAFLREGIKKSCTHDDDVEEDEPTVKEKATLEGDDDHPHKLVKRNSFFKVFKNECIACWCPTSTL